jgi:nucleotide-binding universal stress UspA family protein
MIRHILVGYDGSEPAAKAFDYGLELALKYEAQLRVLAVARPPEFGDDVELEAELESAEEHFRAQFKEMQQRAAARRLAARFEIVVGHPAECIVKFAEKNHIDLIALGSRGRNRFQRWVLGSVSQRVTAYAHCPVTVVR